MAKLLPVISRASIDQAINAIALQKLNDYHDQSHDFIDFTNTANRGNEAVPRESIRRLQVLETDRVERHVLMIGDIVDAGSTYKCLHENSNRSKTQPVKAGALHLRKRDITRMSASIAPAG